MEKFPHYQSTIHHYNLGGGGNHTWGINYELYGSVIRKNLYNLQNDFLCNSFALNYGKFLIKLGRIFYYFKGKSFNDTEFLIFQLFLKKEIYGTSPSFYFSCFAC